MNQTQFIKKLNDELLGDGKTASAGEVYNYFQKFVDNTDQLKDYIDFGLLFFDYKICQKYFADSIFESFLLTLIDIFYGLYQKNEKATIKIFRENILSISNGLKNMFEIILIEDIENEQQRLDLFLKESMRYLGDVIEGTFKPFIKLYFDLYLLDSQNHNIKDESFGTCVTSLIEWKDDFYIMLKSCFLEISISQWRNIAYHRDYGIENGKIKVKYGKSKKHIAFFSKEDVIKVLFVLDKISYLFKTAYTLIGINYCKELTLKDAGDLRVAYNNEGIISQIIETSYSRGYKIISCDKNDSAWVIEATYLTDVKFSKQSFIEYISIVCKFIESDIFYKLRKNAKVILTAERKNGQLIIKKYNE